MRPFYSAFIFLFGFGIRLAANFGNEKAKSWLEGRKDWLKKLKAAVPNDRELIWFHCASLGEFEQARPLLEMIAKNERYFILLTFFSPSGYESKKNYEQADHVGYLPLDRLKNARAFLKVANPKLSFFAKYEFWFNFLKELEVQQRHHFLISGIFRPKQQFFRFYGKWFRKHLAAFSHLYLQDQASVELLRSFGIENCSLSGDGRFDRVWEIARQEVDLPLVESFSQNGLTAVFGSSWTKENRLAFEMVSKQKELKVILAPHEYHPEEIKALEKDFQLEANYYSRLEAGTSFNGSNLLVIDRVGLLAKIYRFGDLAVIGGGFGKGIHNILEAAVYGIPVMFGPNYSFFNEAWELLSKGGAKVFKNEKQFHEQMAEIVNNEAQRKAMGSINQDYFEENTGATQLIYSDLEKRNFL